MECIIMQVSEFEYCAIIRRRCRTVDISSYASLLLRAVPLRLRCGRLKCNWLAPVTGSLYCCMHGCTEALQ